MKAMTYSGPDGSDVPSPTPEFLENIIFRERNRYWRVGSGDSGLSVVEYKAKKAIGIAYGEPALAFWLVERHGFFFTYFEENKKDVKEFVPFAGGDCKPWVRHFVCGVDMYVPRACFVSRPFAWEVVREFLLSKKRSRAVPWVSRFSLEFPNPAAGDEPPARSDRA
jgi:hypothetical protein